MYTDGIRPVAPYQEEHGSWPQTFIVVDKSKTAGARLVAAANALLSLQQNFAALSANSGHMINAADYTQLESLFGVAAGQGANLATLIGLINTILNTSTDVTGPNRLSQLNEFTARLSGQ